MRARPPTEPPRPAAVQDHCLAEHERIVGVLERARAALESGDHRLCTALWTEGASALTRHMDAEENHMLPKLLAAASRSARVMVAEHNHLREAMGNIARSLAFPAGLRDEMRRFVDALRAHQRHELTAVYPWADDALDREEKAALLAI